MRNESDKIEWDLFDQLKLLGVAIIIIVFILLLPGIFKTVEALQTPIVPIHENHNVQ